MKNPLIKRLPRELKGEIGKYIVLFLFITMMIGIVSGFLVAAGSMSVAYDESFEKYNIESGNFELLQKADDDAIKKIEDGEEKIKVYENFYTATHGNMIKPQQTTRKLRIWLRRS